MKKRHIIIIACVAVMALIICGIVFGPKIFGTSPGEPTVAPTPTEIALTTETPTLPPSVTPTPEPSPTETPAPTDSPTPTEEPTETPAPTEKITPTEEPTPEPTEEPTPTDSPTPVPTNTATPEPTKEPTKVPTNTATPVPTKEPTKVPTNTPTNAPTPTEVVVEQPYKMWVKDSTVEVYAPDTSFTQIGTLERGAEVTVIHTNVLNRQANYISEIQYNGGTAYVQYDALSKTYVEGKWTEPRERTDIGSALVRLIDNYRAQNGIRKVENPYVYYDIYNPGVGDRLNSHALRVAKKCCMEYSANHEGGQIGTGIYGNMYKTPMGAEECANALFNNWYNSPAHRANMLDNMNPDSLVLVGTVKVVEWYDGSGYQYCAIQEIAYIPKENLPDGLE